jgi:pilus assembly protein CpaB
LGAAVLALILGAVGVITLVRYVQTAEDRALAGQQLVDVVVVTEPIEAGTPVDELAFSVESRQVPAASRTPGAITDLDGLEGLVASVDLVPGEQLLATRFEDGSIRRVAGGDVTIPPGLVEVTIQVKPTRAVGGQVVPGERVVVIATLREIGQVDNPEIDVPATGPVTGVLLRQALVTNVQAATPEALSSEETDRSRQAPAVDLLVTLALEPAHAERLVFATENGSLWLAREGEGPAIASGPLMSNETVFDGALIDALTTGDPEDLAAADDTETDGATEAATEEDES